MTILGLTGSIGMGKSTTATMFKDLGIPVWDADVAVARAYAKGGAAVPLLEKLFPEVIAANAVNRDALRARVLKNPDDLKKLEEIIHPIVAQDRASFLNDMDTALVVLDIPLLFETGLDQAVDKIAVVSVSDRIQRERVLARGTMSEAQFEAILAKQMPDAEKRKRADYVIPTDTFERARAKVVEIVKELTHA